MPLGFTRHIYIHSLAGLDDIVKTPADERAGYMVSTRDASRNCKRRAVICRKRNFLFCHARVDLAYSCAQLAVALSTSLSIGVTLDVVRRYGSRRDDTRISLARLYQATSLADAETAGVVSSCLTMPRCCKDNLDVSMSVCLSVCLCVLFCLFS